MKWNASAVAALLLLAGCGGGRSYSNYGPEGAGPPPGSIAAQSWGERRRMPPPPAPVEVAPDPAAEPPLAAEPGYVAEAAPPEEVADGSSGAPYAAPAPAPVAARAAPRLAYTAAPQDNYADPAADAQGPRGSSQRQLGEERYDEVGYASILPGDEAAIVAAHRSLPADTLLEVTSLDTGKTALVLVTGPTDSPNDYPLGLSSGAARLLGYDGAGPMGIRMRKVAAAPGDMLALRSGRPASPRPDTPPVLLNALRKHLPVAAAAAAPERPAPMVRTAPPRATSPRPAVVRPATAPAPRAVPGGRFIVQVAALSNAANAQLLARSVGGFVKQGGGLHRVQLGPFATRQQAEAARARVARAGHGDARIVAN